MVLCCAASAAVCVQQAGVTGHCCCVDLLGLGPGWGGTLFRVLGVVKKY